MEPLTESFICEKALSHLYYNHYNRSNLFFSYEQHTTKGKRADGLLAFAQKKGKAYVVSLEAKSRNTLHNLKLNEDSQKILHFSRWSAGIGLLLVAIFVYKSGERYVLEPMWVTSVSSLVICGVLLFYQIYKWLNISFFKAIPALQQLTQYTANESWLAIGKDSILDKKIKRQLKSKCKKSGVGLLEVQANGNVRQLVLPKPKGNNDYLEEYLEENSIRQQIGKTSFYKSTPAQRYYSFVKGLNAVVALIFILSASFAFNDNRGNRTVRGYEEYALSSQIPNHNKHSVECGEFNIFDDVFIISDALEGTWQAAEKRARELFSLGFTNSAYFHFSCVGSDFSEAVYCVIPFDPINDIAEAEKNLDTYFNLLNEADKETGFGKIIQIWPK